ncbi:hypothetical protein [Paracoccus niistensis]|uniref:Uncharacterized protein n=1 Tax=Paracoccus niistensis TaxID=632935 RepID=A0ABV6I667_9RHOB
MRRDGGLCQMIDLAASEVLQGHQEDRRQGTSAASPRCTSDG